MAGGLRRLVIGERLPTKVAKHQRLPKILALPVFASDALSSTAYATEEILRVLTHYLVPVMGAAALGYSIPIAIGIATLLVIVTISYQQTIHAYPGGGGAYIVARDNLGEAPAQIAGAALLTDYVLTVSVSIAAGVAAIDSAFPALLPYRVPLCVLCIVFMTIANLRGVKESALLFAGPTYLFLLSMIVLLLVGFLKMFRHELTPMTEHLPAVAAHVNPLSTFAFIFIILHAGANGCAAITGTEAISNGVTAFRPPEARNAAITLLWAAFFLTTIFLGLTVLARVLHIVPVEHETVVSQLGRVIFGRSPFYYVIQAATCMILILAANTAYADFPRLANLHANDGFLPRQLTQLGDRLVFQNGIVILGIISSLLVIVFRGKVDALIPLYAIGVFLSFTMSQTGMVKRWFRLRTPGWRSKAFINGLGAICCAVVMFVFAATKFREGAWIVILMVPLLVVGFFRIHHHYREVAQELSLEEAGPASTTFRHRVLVLIPGIHRGILPALSYARTISDDVEAVFVEILPHSSDGVKEKWPTWGNGVPLRVIKSPWREFLEPLITYIDMTLDDNRLDLLTVIIPEFVTARWWHRLLHNQTGFRLKLALLNKPNVVVSNVRYHLGRRRESVL